MFMYIAHDPYTMLKHPLYLVILKLNPALYKNISTFEIHFFNLNIIFLSLYFTKYSSLNSLLICTPFYLIVFMFGNYNKFDYPIIL